MITKISLSIILALSALGAISLFLALLRSGYYGGLAEAYKLLGLLICLVVFIISAGILYREIKHRKSKANNS